MQLAHVYLASTWLGHVLDMSGRMLTIPEDYFLFLPGHIAELHFPAVDAVGLDHEAVLANGM